MKLKTNNTTTSMLIVCLLIALQFSVYQSIAQSSKMPKALKLNCYKLENGLSVYLNEDSNASTVMGLVAIKGGSNLDPEDATGLAHYFEHIMFKGTKKLGTLDYASEKIYLDSITACYDQLIGSSDSLTRQAIQSKINKLSIKASEFAIPNEFSRMIKELGSNNFNAFTSKDKIAYFNSFPANQVEKWLELYSDRFTEPVFRLFQSELETVYEEKNWMSDKYSFVFQELADRQTFKNTPYAHPVIGESEHLKNPSISKMQAFFNTYYVPNNMVLVLSGNFDSKKVIPLVDEKFGRLRNKKLPKQLPIKLEPFKGREQYIVSVSPNEMGRLTFHTVQESHKDKLILDICAKILSNNLKTGLLDDLKANNNLAEVSAFNNNMDNVGTLSVDFTPLMNQQSLEEAEHLIIQQLDHLKLGNFDNTTLEGVRAEMKKEHESKLEDSKWRVFHFMNVFIYDIAWNDILHYSDIIDKITKEDILEVSNKYLGKNYLSFYSKIGTAEKDKIAKPTFKSIDPKNRELKSDYAQAVSQIQVREESPKFIRAGKDYSTGKIYDNARYFYVENPVNKIFSLEFSFKKGKIEDPELGIVALTVPYCSAAGMTNKEFYTKLQLLGTDLQASSDDNYLHITLTGLENNLVPTLRLINNLFKNPELEEEKKMIIVNNLRKYDKEDMESLFTKTRALIEYVRYGKQSFFLQEPTAEEVENTTPDQLINTLKKAFHRQVDIHYSGTIGSQKLRNILKANLDYTKTFIAHPDVEEKELMRFDENVVYYLNDKNARQSMIGVMVISNKNDKADDLDCELFNRYFCGGSGSVLVQEIREFRSLAYSVGGYYDMPGNRKNGSRFFANMSTQADKTIPALEVLTNLIKEMPYKPERIGSIKTGLKQSVNDKFPSFREITNSVSNWEQKGYSEDPNKIFYPALDGLSFDNIVNFHNKYIKDNRIVTIVVGDIKQEEVNKLNQFGKVIEIHPDMIF